MNIPDHISISYQSLETIFCVKILKFLDADADPGSDNLFDSWSGMEIGFGIWDKHPGSATLIHITNYWLIGAWKWSTGTLHCCLAGALSSKPNIGTYCFAHGARALGLRRGRSIRRFDGLPSWAGVPLAGQLGSEQQQWLLQGWTSLFACL